MRGFLAGKAAKKQTAAGRIIQVLSKEHPLHLMEIYRKLKSDYKSEISFQAARKAANALCEDGILSKSSEKEYELSRKWILESKKFFDNLTGQYQNRSRIFNRSFKSRDYSEYKFTTLFELDNFWNDLLTYWVDNLGKDEPKLAYNYNNMHWWFLINLGYEMTLWKHIKSRGVKCIFVTHGKNFFNEMAVKNYNSIAANSASFTKRPPFPENLDVNAIGNHIIEVTFPANIRKKIENVMQKYNSAEEVLPKDLNELMDTKCDIRLVYFRNPEVAKAYREKILAGIGK